VRLVVDVVIMFENVRRALGRQDAVGMLRAKMLGDPARVPGLVPTLFGEADCERPQRSVMLGEDGGDER
jgi:hypothetical protein